MTRDPLPARLRRPDIPSLTGRRAFAALAVVISHFRGCVSSAVAVVAVGVLLADGPDRRWIVPLFAVIVFAFACAQGRTKRILGSGVPVFCGEASYALYMTHGVVEQIGGKAFPLARLADAPVPLRLLVVAGYLAVILGVAAGTYLLVERPARDRLRRMIDPRIRASSAALVQPAVATQA